MIPYSCSIALYAINLMREVVPEKHAQILKMNHRIRLLTPDRVAFNAFGICLRAKPNQAVSSFLVERSRVLGPGSCYPIGVMY